MSEQQKTKAKEIWRDKDQDFEVCRECDGNGALNPPRWDVKCLRCGGKGQIIAREALEKIK